jgi:hypothetical protein
VPGRIRLRRGDVRAGGRGGRRRGQRRWRWGRGGDDSDGSVEVQQCGVVEEEILLGATTTGTTVGGGTELGCNCNSCPGPEVVHRLLVEGDMVPVTIQATTDLAGTGYDAVLYVRRACDDATTELACDDAGEGDTLTFEATEAGIYYVIVDSHEGGSGNYELEVTVVD